MTLTRSLRTAAVLAALVLALSACSAIPREHTSPCACDWRPLAQTEGTLA